MCKLMYIVSIEKEIDAILRMVIKDAPAFIELYRRNPMHPKLTEIITNVVDYVNDHIHYYVYNTVEYRELFKSNRILKKICKENGESYVPDDVEFRYYFDTPLTKLEERKLEKILTRLYNKFIYYFNLHREHLFKLKYYKGFYVLADLGNIYKLRYTELLERMWYEDTEEYYGI